MQQMKSGIDGMENKMEANTQTLRGEMQRMGLDLQKGQGALKEELKCLQAGKMAPPRAGTNELRGSATAVRPAVGAGEEKIIRETCRGDGGSDGDTEGESKRDD